jgi:hypothetical protein
MEIIEVDLEIPAVVQPRDLVHPGCGPWVQRPVGRPEAIDIDVVQERGEPCFLVLLRYSAHAIQLT